jgi:putative acetyltransferase
MQGRGIGSRLIGAGLAAAPEPGYDFAVVLGEPAYDRRFGFTIASRAGLQNEYGVLALHADGLRDASGLVRYQPEFSLVAP